jgi:hypothetical protein
MKQALLALALALTGVAASGCYVEEHAYVGARHPRPACRHAHYVQGWYGRHGRYHPGYWECGGPRRVIIVE